MDQAEADMDKGDRVIATKGIGGKLRAKVPKGTKSVVTEVSGDLPARYTVHFENGETADCSERQIHEPD